MDEPRSHSVQIVVPDATDCDRSGETLTIDVAEDEYVLTVARGRGIWLPADCQQGWCTTCAARLIEGAVDQADARRYYDEDREAGLVLLCRAKPRSDLRVVVCQQEAMLDHRASYDLPPGTAKR